MSTIKQDRVDLEMLLNGIDPLNKPTAIPGNPNPNTQNPVNTPSQYVDNSSDAMGVQKSFEFDYDSIKKGIRKRARRTVLNITKHILDQKLTEDEYIKDKIEQDIDTLADLYMQVETNNLMQRSLIETVSKGNSAPRLYEVFGQLTDKIQALNKQIIDTEQKIRKTYIDLKYEIRDREAESHRGQGTPVLAAPKDEPNRIITSSKQLIEMAKKRHAEQYKNTMQEDVQVVEEIKDDGKQ